MIARHRIPPHMQKRLIVLHTASCHGMIVRVGVLCEGSCMDTRRSYYLQYKQDDFAEPAADASRLDFNDIPFVVPANDSGPKIACRPAVGVCFVV